MCKRPFRRAPLGAAVEGHTPQRIFLLLLLELRVGPGLCGALRLLPLPVPTGRAADVWFTGRTSVAAVSASVEWSRPVGAGMQLYVA